jgi:hypothetical protein
MNSLTETPSAKIDLDSILEPVDWSHLCRLAKLTPGQRILAMSQSSAFARSILRGSFRRRYPDRPLAEINMLMLEYLKTAPEYIR